ncbi:MAG: hypothetical protein ABI622_10565 [Chloroflexota bacterium]
MTVRWRAAVALVALAGMTAACPGPDPPPSTSPAIPLPTTGRPYDAQQVLAAMRESRRPGGVPDQLETGSVAAELATAIWTYDGRPYPSLMVSGSCGPERCALEVSGAPAGAAGADLYAFNVVPATGAVELLAADLHGYPGGVDTILDRVARDALQPEMLNGLGLTAATWLLPPRIGFFRAAYRSGGEEGSPGLDVLIDLTLGTVVETTAP